MPNTRMLLWVALAAILYLNYEAWMHDYPAVGQRDTQSQSATGVPGTGGDLGDSVPQAASSAAPPATAPKAVAPAPTAEAFTPPAAGAAPTADDSTSQPVRVSTDVFNVVINLKGGELDQADLLQYPLRKDAPNIPVRLLSREPPDSLYLLQTGLSGGARETAPTHLTTLRSVEKTFLLPPGAKEPRGPFTSTDGQGLTRTQTFLFTRCPCSLHHAF